MGRGWYVYQLLANDGSLYTGVTKDVERRLHEHNHTKRGAKCLRGKRPVVLLASIPARGSFTRSAALKHEAHIKKLPTALKPYYLNGFCSNLTVHSPLEWALVLRGEWEDDQSTGRRRM